MKNKIDIRVLGPGDLCTVKELSYIMIAAWRAGFRNILPDSVIEQYTQFEPCTDMFRQILSSGIGTMYLAQLKGQSVGLLYWLPEGGTARIEALLTVPEVWGKGVATALMDRALADSTAFSSPTVWPFRENHRAKRFYEKHGFTPTGHTRMGDAWEVEYVYIPSR